MVNKINLDLSVTDQFLLMDCGSTTTKALLFSNNDSKWSLNGIVNTPTTVEAPNNDVTIGVNNSINQMHVASNAKFIGLDKIPFIATSSAGGGLQIAVIGLTSEISTAAAYKTALNSGAIVSLVCSADDELLFSQKVKQLQSIKPDMIILAGGLEDATPLATIDTISIIKEAKLKPRYGAENKLPLIYCGTSSYSNLVESELGQLYEVNIIPNLLSLDFSSPNDNQLKQSIQDLFLSTVMHHAPGYSKLCQLVTQPIMPTPMAVTKIIQSLSDLNNQSVLAVDIGGATTDIYTVFTDREKIVQRSVSANFGMSYSAASVLNAAGLASISEHCPDFISQSQIETYIWNKTLYPTSVPTDELSIKIEQALCISALKLSYLAHRQVCGSTFPMQPNFDFCIASGGVLSHAPDLNVVPWIMADGFNLVGVSQIAVDKVFMMPHLGALSEVDKQIASTLLFQECLVPLCWLVGAISAKKLKKGSSLAKVYIEDNLKAEIIVGNRDVLPLEINHNQNITVRPINRHIDCGAGKGNEFKYTFKSSSNLPLYLDGARC